MSRSKYTALEKLNFINEFNQSNISQRAFAKYHGLRRSTFKYWLIFYETFGIKGLMEVKKNNKYSTDFKYTVVMAYLNGEGTLSELMSKFGLRSCKQLIDWINKYNEDKTLTATPFRKKVPVMSRKTTFEERIEIVEWITKGKHSYAEATEHFKVSYQQVRSWVIKAQTGGYESLADNRGHRKPTTELTETDKLKRENRQLKAQLAEKKILEEFVKKYMELQRRG